MKITKHDLFKSALKIRLEDCVKYIIESNNIHTSNLDFIEDELTENFFRELNAIEYSLNFGIINTYSLFDFFLSSFCINLQEHFHVEYKKFNAKNENIGRAKFIKSVLGFDIREHDSWEPIDHYRKIRNLLIHNNLNIYSKNQNLKMNPDKATIQLINIINKNAFLGFDINSGRVYIENVQFVIDFKNNVLNLFTILIQTLKNHSE